MTLKMIFGTWTTPNLQNRHQVLTIDLSSSVIVTFIIAVPATSIMRPLAGGREELFVVLAVLAILLVVELVGNAWVMLPSWHLGAEIAGAVVVSSTGLGIVLTKFEAVNIALTILWFVTIAYAFKLVDRPIRLAAGTATIACLTLFALASANGQILVSTLAIGLVGCISGFLIQATRNGKLHLGESTIRVIGFLIAFLAIQIDGPVNRVEGLVNALMPILICSFVLFNLSLVTVSRLLAGDSQAPPGRGGVSGELLAIGLPPPTVRSWSFSIAGAVGVFSYMIYRLDPAVEMLLTGTLGLAYLVGGVLLIRASLHTENQGGNASISRRLKPR